MEKSPLTESDVRQIYRDSAPVTNTQFRFAISRLTAIVQSAIKDLNTRIDQRLTQIKDGYTPVKGKDYVDGKDAQPVDEQKLVQTIMGKIRQPKDGETPIVDHQKIAEMAVTMIEKPKNPDENAIANRVIEQVISRALPEIEKRIPALSLAVRDALELLPPDERPTMDILKGVKEHIAGLIAEHAYLGGASAAIRVMKAGAITVQAAQALNFKGAGAPTVTVGANGVTDLEFSGTSGTQVYDEVVSGSGTTFTLANTPTVGTVRVYARGQRLLPTQDYTISGAVITTNDSWSAGDISADYQY